jgi:hypothetical protein
VSNRYAQKLKDSTSVYYTILLNPKQIMEVGKTTRIVVNSIDEADFIIELQVIKKAMANRSAKIKIKNILSYKVV